uniref:Uncharacterized protein n=1 Tax=Plectus sambesii TaxID=2011161 RepID=A0A914XFB4_9BILA
MSSTKLMLLVVSMVIIAVLLTPADSLPYHPGYHNGHYYPVYPHHGHAAGAVHNNHGYNSYGYGEYHAPWRCVAASVNTKNLCCTPPALKGVR